MDWVIPEVVDCMTPGPHVVGPDDTLRRAEELMLENGIRHLPVVTVAGEVVGILSDRDVARALALTHKSLDAILVEDAMTPDPYCVGPNALLNAVARTMAERKVGSAIVWDRRAVVGVFTTTDALHALADTLEGKQPRHLYESVPTVPNSRSRSHEQGLR
jgi:acetoin utilization protein AcuB